MFPKPSQIVDPFMQACSNVKWNYEHVALCYCERSEAILQLPMNQPVK